jgi:hypothetical protein
MLEAQQLRWAGGDKIMNSSKNTDIGRQLKGDDYLDLWKYFQSRADQLKEDMFKTVTWVIGFAATVLGFIVNKFVDFDPAKPLINHKGLAAIFCLVGLVLCLYAGVLLSEFANHISRNWERSNLCKDKVAGLSDLIKGMNLCSKRQVVPIWWRIGGVVIIFSLAFVSGLIFIAVSQGADMPSNEQG